jgi:hypothetical protein
MWQGYLIRQVPSHASPLFQRPRRRVYTPTPNGFERFLGECVGLSRNKGAPTSARGPRTERGTTPTTAAEITWAFSF